MAGFEKIRFVFFERIRTSVMVTKARETTERKIRRQKHLQIGVNDL